MNAKTPTAKKFKTAKPPKGMKTRPIIGWREWVGLSELGVDRLKAKIDTGARTSAIHAFHIRPFSDAGTEYVSFKLHPAQRHRVPEVECICPVRDQRKVKSSNGKQELRYVIETHATVGAFTWPIEITLADRDQMGFRMLLGREAVRRHFIIEPGRSYLGARISALYPSLKERKLAPK